MKLRNKLLGGVALAGVLATTLAAGFFTNGLPWITAGAIGGVTQPLPNNGGYSQLYPGQSGIVSAAGAPSGVTPLPASNCCGPFVPVDTNNPGGAAPQTVAATPFQVAMTLLDGLNNTQTSTVHAATSNTLGGVVITESLSTAAGSTYTFTLTNSQLTAAYANAGYVPQVAIYSISNTGGRCASLSGTAVGNTGCMQLVSQTLSVGSVVWVFQNNGSTALNGTMYIGWHI